MTTTNSITSSINTVANFGKMLKKSYLVGILTATTLGMLPLAAFATPTSEPCCQNRSGGDNAVVQSNTQEANVTGKGNSVNQNSNQSANISGGSTSPTSTVRSTPKKPVRARRTVARPAPCKTISDVKI
ncbi:MULTISPECIES: hypothetical protein [Aerosakkonema]|uniref:hypothetical protein n=1 Tax=Aerosakkonema TaxID=1246629 RepID=UPI0035BAD608